MTRLCLIAALLLGISGAAYAAEEPVTERTMLSPGIGFRMVTRQAGNVEYMIQYAKTGETQQNWTWLISNNFSANQNVTPEQHFHHMEEGMRRLACSDGASQVIKERSSEHVLTGLLICPKNQKSGKGEISTVTLVKEPDGLSVVLIETRRDSFDMASFPGIMQQGLQKDIEALLERIETCRSQDGKRSCKPLFGKN